MKKHNMGYTERLLRVIGGALVFMLSAFLLGGFNVLWGVTLSTSKIGFALALAGLVVFITGAKAYCPINSLLHTNSCEACKVGETHSHLPV